MTARAFLPVTVLVTVQDGVRAGRLRVIDRWCIVTDISESAEKRIASPGSLTLAKALTLVALVAGVTWSYWPVFAEMANKWSNDAQYSHGYLVPLFSLFLAGRWFRSTGQSTLTPSWFGLAFLSAGLVMRLVGARFYLEWIEAVSLLPTLAGIVLILAGWQTLRQLWPAILFLIFMVPLPFRVETGLSHPLQRIATKGSTYVLQTIGRQAFSEGNVIVINDSRIGVVDACNGLGMFLLFFAMAGAVAIMVHRPLWEKAIIILSAAPIAVGVNIFRISVTALLHEFVGSEWADKVFHDFAGWVMMPLALLTLIVELKLLSLLFIEEVPSTSRPVAQMMVGRANSAAIRKNPVMAVRSR
jgi:exosortase